MEKSRLINIVGWVASIIGSISFLSYFDQAYLNVQGIKGSLILPIFTLLNCSLWSYYAIMTKQKCILTVNIIGIVGCLAAALTWFF